MKFLRQVFNHFYIPYKRNSLGGSSKQRRFNRLMLKQLIKTYLIDGTFSTYSDVSKELRSKFDSTEKYKYVLRNQV